MEEIVFWRVVDSDSMDMEDDESRRLGRADNLLDEVEEDGVGRSRALFNRWWVFGVWNALH